MREMGEGVRTEVEEKELHVRWLVCSHEFCQSPAVS